MATEQTREEPHEGPAGDLPDPSMLGIDDYLEMYRAVGNRARYEILKHLVYSGDMSPTQLEELLTEEIGIDDSTLYYHLGQLVDTGLVAKRARTEDEQEGFDTYYRATIFGEKAITGGIDDLIENEHEFDNMYNSSG